MKKNLPKTRRRGKRSADCHLSCFNEESYRKCVAVRDSGVLQVCHFGAISWQEPELLTSCLWWSSQLQSFPGARRLLDPVQCFSVMKIKINSPCSFWECVCNQCNWTGAASPGCHCLSPCLLSWLHLTSTWSSPLWARGAAVHHQLLYLSFWKMESVYLHSYFPTPLIFGKGWLGGGICASWVDGKAALLWWSADCPASLFLRLGGLWQDYMAVLARG